MQQVDELGLQRILKLLYIVTVAIVKLGTSDIRARRRTTELGAPETLVSKFAEKVTNPILTVLQ